VVRGNVVETEEIPAYCAVALAGLGWLPDTLLSRSVIIRMRRRKPGEKVKPFRRRTELKAGYTLKTRLRLWARRVQPSITWPTMPPGVEDRDADIWEALIAVAKAAGGIWPDRASRAALALIKEARDREPSLGIRLLADLKTVFGDAQEMTTATILHCLHALPESPWNDLKGKPLNDRGLAIRLRQYSIKPKPIRFDGAASTLRGYTAEDLHDAWETYLPPSQDEESETSETSETSDQNANVSNAENVSDDIEASETTATASETAADNVSDGEADVSDDVSDDPPKNVSNNNNVSDVSLVSLRPAADRGPADLRYRLNQRGEVCAHCGQPGDLHDCAYDGIAIRLHRRCQYPWTERYEAAAARNGAMAPCGVTLGTSV
jgi:hypothetical protein